jgi:dihydroaeruginoic acid synthetase
MAAFYRQPTLAGLAAQLAEAVPAASASQADGDASVATIEEGVL